MLILDILEGLCAQQFIGDVVRFTDMRDITFVRMAQSIAERLSKAVPNIRGKLGVICHDGCE